MTPLLLALGIHCTLLIVVLTRIGGGSDSQRNNFLDTAYFLHLAGLIYFGVKVSDLIFGWSA